MNYLKVAMLSVSVFAQTAFGLPLHRLSNAPDSAAYSQYGISLQTMSPFFTTDYNFAGIVGLDNCSGSLVRFENSKDTDAALVLTNGHCYEGGFARPGAFTYGVESSRRFSIQDATSQNIGSLQAVQVVYSTMTKTDVTIYKLDESFASIAGKFQIQPLTLASHHPSLNDPIEVISGYWHRGYNCKIEAFIPSLHEEDWVWDDSIRYSRPGCETIGGTSGSPIVLQGTRIMIGINNTGNESGGRCTENNPCEVDANGNVSYTLGYSYGQQTNLIYTCLNSNNEFDLSVPGCTLPH